MLKTLGQGHLINNETHYSSFMLQVLQIEREIYPGEKILNKPSGYTDIYSCWVEGHTSIQGS